MYAKTSTTLLVCLAAPSVLCQNSCIPPYTVVSGDTLYSIWQRVGQATSWDTFSTSVCLENNPSYTDGQTCVKALGDPNSGLMPVGRQLTFNSVCNSGATTNQATAQTPQAQSNPPLIIPAGQSPSPTPVTPNAPLIIPAGQSPSPSTATPTGPLIIPAGQSPSPSPVTPQVSINTTNNTPVPSPSGKIVPTDLCPALYFRGIGTPVDHCGDGLMRIGALCYPGSKPMGCPPTREYLRGLCYTPCNATYHEHVSEWCQRNNDDCT